MSGVLGPDLVLWATYKISWLYTCTGNMYCRLYNIHIIYTIHIYIAYMCEYVASSICYTSYLRLSSLRDGAPLLVGRQILLMLMLMLIILACLKFVAHLVQMVHIVLMLHMVQPIVCGHQLLNSVVQYAEQRLVCLRNGSFVARGSPPPPSSIDTWAKNRDGWRRRLGRKRPQNISTGNCNNFWAMQKGGRN